MEMHELSDYRKQRNLTKMAKVAAVVLGLTALGYIGVTLLQHAGPWLTITSRFMLESQMVNSEASVDSVDAQAGSGAATAAVPVPPASHTMTHDFDYFPDHYVNQATKNEEPVATF
ncbi:MAG: hypothetical protein E6H66_17515 [Betaproteobacteria bacterium]|nr:MAG: hypothetical protein E6H66_17515 [Betaproteobacteria bacterium]